MTAHMWQQTINSGLNYLYVQGVQYGSGDILKSYCSFRFWCLYFPFLVGMPDTKKHNNIISLKCLPLHLEHPVIGIYILCQTRRCIAGGTNTILQLQLGVAPWWWIIHVFNTDSNCFPGQMSGYYSPYASGFTAAQMAAAAAAAAAQQSSQVNKKK